MGKCVPELDVCPLAVRCLRIVFELLNCHHDNTRSSFKILFVNMSKYESVHMFDKSA